MKGVTLIICCYNSTIRIQETLFHIATQEVRQDISWEVILVDNNSTDNTASVAVDIWKKYNPKGVEFKIVNEKKSGLIYARQAGIEASKFEYITFCDDDNWLSKDYVSIVYEVMESDPLIAVLGGCGIYQPEQPVSKEIEPFSGMYVNGPQEEKAKKNNWVYGAGSTYRKEIFELLRKTKWQQLTTGRKGKRLISGEDVELCFMIYLCGYKIQASDRLTFKHFVPVSRQNLDYIMKLSFWIHYSYFLLYPYIILINNDTRDYKQIKNSILRANWNGLKNASRKYLSNKFKKNDTIKERKEIRSCLGMIYSVICNSQKVYHQKNEVEKIVSSINKRMEQLQSN